MEINQTLETTSISQNLSNTATKKEAGIKKDLKDQKGQEGLSTKEASVKVDLSSKGLEEAKTIDFFAEEANLDKLKDFASASMYGTAQATIPASTVINLLI